MIVCVIASTIFEISIKMIITIAQDTFIIQCRCSRAASIPIESTTRCMQQKEHLSIALLDAMLLVCFPHSITISVCMVCSARFE